MNQQTNLVHKRKKTLRWGSHIPVHKALFKTFKISGTLELGAGHNSTPMLSTLSNKSTSIETDINWINTLKEKYNFSENHQFVHHKIPKYINRSTPAKEINDQIMQEASDLYLKYSSENLNFLFIDCDTCFRLKALELLHDKFDFITYHDAEEPETYGYDKFKPNINYFHFIERRTLAYTGILISKKYEKYIDLFLENLEKEINEYLNNFNVVAYKELKRI